MNDSTLCVGGMAAVSTLVGHLLGGEILRDGRRLVGNTMGGGPYSLPWLRLGLSHVAVLTMTAGESGVIFDILVLVNCGLKNLPAGATAITYISSVPLQYEENGLRS